MRSGATSNVTFWPATRGRTPDASIEAVRDVVAFACEYLADEGDFAEVLLLEDDTDLVAAGATVVSGRAELVAALGLQPRALRGSAAQGDP